MDLISPLRDSGHFQVPIFAMTANVLKENRAACMAAGADEFLAKPFKPDELYEKLVEWMT